MMNYRSALDLEQWRGQVPDEILAAAYNGCRNHAFLPDVRLRVRQLAGVVDENGEPLPWLRSP